MAEGDIVYATAPIDMNAYDSEDIALSVTLEGLFPNATYEVLHTQIIDITGNHGERKTVLIALAHDTQ